MRAQTTRVRVRARLATVAAVVAVAAGAAPASAAVVPNVAYGGGALTPAAPLIGLRIAASGARVAFEGEVIARCAGRPPVDERLTVLAAGLTAEGSFHGYATRTYRLSPRETRTVRLAVTGQVVDARRASGMLRLLAYVHRVGRPTVRCDSREQHWEGRSVPGVTPGPPAPLAGASYYGGTTQRGREIPFPFALRVASDGRNVDTSVFRVHRRCTGVVSNDVPNDMPPAAIAPDGAFSVTQRYSQRFVDSTEFFTFTLAGRFVTEGASGTLRATSLLRDLRTRRVIGRCNSGLVRWAAAP